jgi:hypothetical protein
MRHPSSGVILSGAKDLNWAATAFERLSVEVRSNWTGIWFRDVDSNHDTQLQRLMSYRLDDPGTASSSLAELRNSAQTPRS